MSASRPQPAPAPAVRRRFGAPRLIRWCLAAAIGLWLAAALCLAGLRWIDPPLTAVQAQRRIQAKLSGKAYQRRYSFAPLDRIAPEFQRAVVAAEDARFYQHHGFDWTEIRNAMDDEDDRPVRGASTITQQLVKNLFFGTSRSYVRKGIEASLVPVAEFALGKRRILELYLNVAEWGPGVYGAEAAARYHYSTTARKVDRTQALRLAAILPSPLRRRPERMTKYSAVIDARMRQMGW
jgi:monofunctional biosynthetic peptidoglycan transglycosylase